jgi:hypothetical protein
MSNGRFMTTVMCDDVRREEGNKLSYMGIYGPTLLVPQFPIALPKLCFVMSVACSGDSDPPRSLSFRLFSNDDLMGEVVLPESALAKAQEQNENSDDRESRRLVFSSVLQIFPLQLSSPCVLKARAICDGVELKGGSWSVERIQ